MLLSTKRPDLSSKALANEYAQRLQRIWVPQGILGGRLTWKHSGDHFYLWYRFHLKAASECVKTARDEVTFSIERVGDWEHGSYCLRNQTKDIYGESPSPESKLKWAPQFGAFSEMGKPASVEEKEALSHSIERFRRDLFLSYCPIECTMHEEMQWTLWFEKQTRTLPQWEPLP